jgi:alpha-1,2-mannosyltransferase
VLAALATSILAVLSALTCLCVVKGWVCLPGESVSQEAVLLRQCWRILICCIFGGLCIDLIVNLVAGSIKNSTLTYAWDLFFNLGQGDDSWLPMLKASEHLRDHPGVPVYQAIFFDQKIKFQYPLSSLLLIDVPRWLFKLSDTDAVLLVQVISRLAVPAFAVSYALVLVAAVRAEIASQKQLDLSPATWAALIITGLAAILFFFPIVRGERLGQIQTLITFDATLALYAWQRRRVGLSGILIGLCCVVKPQWAIIIAWAALRRQWRFVIGCAVTVGIILAWAAWFYGLGNLIAYSDVVSFLAKRGEGLFSNQSVNGLVNRILFNGHNLQWSDDQFPPFNWIVYASTFVSSLVIIGTAIFWDYRRSPKALDFALIMLALTIASPIAWEHHYGIMFPIFLVMLPACLRLRPWGRSTVPLFFISYGLISENFTAATNRLADTYFNVLQSSLFFGALIALTLLFSLTRVADDGVYNLNGKGADADLL